MKTFPLSAFDSLDRIHKKVFEIKDNASENWFEYREKKEIFDNPSSNFIKNLTGERGNSTSLLHVPIYKHLLTNNFHLL